jgi:signal transduction histidine kinase
VIAQHLFSDSTNLECQLLENYIFKVKLKLPILSLRTRITAVVILILFAAGLSITYFNSVNTEKILVSDARKSSESILMDFSLDFDHSGYVNTATLDSNAYRALKFLTESEFVGFYKLSTDSTHNYKYQLIAYAGKKIDEKELSSLIPKVISTNFPNSELSLEKYPPLRKNLVSSTRLGGVLYSVSVLSLNDGRLWGYALTKSSLRTIEKIIRKTQITGIEITLAICIFSSILLLYAMRLTFLRPFGALAKAMRSAAEGNLHTRLSAISGMEFKTLSGIFNEMMNELQKADEIVKDEFKIQEEYRTKLQREIKLATETLREKSNEIISLQERLRTFESQAALVKTASKLAHQLGGPLNAIYASVQLLLESDIPDDKKVKLQVIERQVDTMITTINQFLQTRKIAVPSKKMVPLKNLIEDTKLVTEPALNGKSITLDIEVENLSMVLYADPIQIQQVLINLINNAIDAIEMKRRKPGNDNQSEHGKIELKIYQDYEFNSKLGFQNLRFDISDTGEGVPQEIIPQLFNDFIESKKPNGNGIGLVICKEIVDGHGGKIFLARNSENGSTFSVILPIEEKQWENIKSGKGSIVSFT